MTQKRLSEISNLPEDVAEQRSLEPPSDVPAKRSQDLAARRSQDVLAKRGAEISKRVAAKRPPAQYVVEDESYPRALVDDDDDDVAITVRPARKPTSLSPAARARQRRRSKIFSVAFILTPLLVSAIYLFSFCSDIFEVDTVLMIKAPSTSEGGSSSGSSSGSGIMGALGAMGGGGGSPMSRAIDESYAVVQFIQSREAFRELDEAIGFRERFTQSTIDWLHRLRADADFETAYRWYTQNVTASYDDVSGQILLTTSGLDPKSAFQIGKGITDISERLVNEFNDRATADFIKLARRNVEQTRADLKKASDDVTDFQLHNSMISPATVSTTFATIIGGLLTQAANLQAQIDSLGKMKMGSSPQVGPLKSQLSALYAQVAREQEHLTGLNGSVAPQLAKFDYLQTQQQVAQQEYTGALGTLSSALFQAQRQKLYVVSVVPPRVPEQPTQPRRWKDLLIVFLSTVAAWISLRIVIAAIWDHMV